MATTTMMPSSSSSYSRCAAHCQCGDKCTCGDNCQCTETICRCEASSVLNSLGLLEDQDEQLNNNVNNSPTTIAVVELSVQGMSCASCVNTVQRVLQPISQNVQVDLKQGRVVVAVVVPLIHAHSDANNKTTTANEMVRLIQDVAGFEASIVSIQLQNPKEQTMSTTPAEERRRQNSQNMQEASPLFSSPPYETTTDALLSSSSSQPEKSATVSPQPNNIQTVELVVDGMTCSMCTKAIVSTLQQLEGVVNASVSLVTDTATVQYDALSELQIAQMTAAIQSIGYQVTDVLERNNNNNNDDNALEPSSNTSEDRLQRLQQRQQAQVIAKQRAFLWSLVGTLPILVITMVLPHVVAIFHWPTSLMQWLNGTVTILGHTFIREALILWILATPVQFISGFTFYRGAWYGIQTGQLGMDVLVAMGTTASYVYALVDTFWYHDNTDASSHEHDGAHFFETSAVLICFVLLGKWMNSLAVRRTSDALTQLLQLQSKTALLVMPSMTTTTENDDKVNINKWDPTTDAYTEETVPIGRIRPGNIVKVLRGASIPADGVVSHGEASVDESMITGESVPILKTKGSIVLGGTVCVEASLSNDSSNSMGAAFVRVTGVGSSTALSQIVRLVQDAQTKQVPIQNFADTISAVFVPTVATLSVVTFLVWYALCNTGVVPKEWYEELQESPATFSLMFGIACLVISCPCALGLATPTAVMVGTGVGAKNGVLVKGGDSLEKGSAINTVVFDKTGTLTKGQPCITDFCRIHDEKMHDTDNEDPSGWTLNYLLWLLGSLERNSEHPLAKAVVSYAESQMDSAYLESHPFAQPSNFRALTGRGASGVIDESITVAIGNRPFAAMMDLPIPPRVEDQMTQLEEDGKTAILGAINGSVCVVMGIADELKPDAAASISYLQDQMGMDVWMVTGDNSRTARAISRRLNLPLDRVISEALPVAKVRKVRKLQSEGYVVAMIGDGINDSPALAQADVGMSLGTGAEIAAEASDMVLVKGHVADVCTALDLSRVIFRRIQLNFMWSLLYNCCGIPVAAGVLFPLIRTRLPPTLAAVAMALSSLSVVSSSLALRLYRPPDVIAVREASLPRNGWRVRCESLRQGCMQLLQSVRLLFSRSSDSVVQDVNEDGDNDKTQSLLANDHALGGTLMGVREDDPSTAADSQTRLMEEGHA